MLPPSPGFLLPPRALPLTRWRRDRAASLIGDRIGRFRDPVMASQPEVPFPGYVEQPRATGPLPPEFPLRPVFSRSGGRAVVEIPLPTIPGVSLYGTGEQAGSLLRNGTRKTLWNSDSFDYTERTRSLYQAHPYVLIVHPDGTSFGVIVESTWRCEIDLTRGCVFRVEGPSPAVTIIHRDEPGEVVRALAELTGKMPMPPRWALGYHQCRWSYEPESRFKDLVKEFRSRKIPCDVLWFDIDYMRGFRCFTHDDAKFPNPRKLNEHLHENGFRAIYMIDPGIKVDPGYAVYKSGEAGKHWIRRATDERGVARDAAIKFRSVIPDDVAEVWGLERPLPQDARDGRYFGQVWPGTCVFPDFTRSRTRRWWSELYGPFMKWGIDGVWNDMNEPAVFDGAGKSMPLDNLHDADRELGGPGPHLRYHNVYGMLMTRATREGIEAARPGKRPFVLTRANFLGGQRYAATWTGDNRSDWNHLRWSIPMVLNLGLSGQPFSGPDIGGFIGDATPALFAAWMGIGAMLPFCRSHSDKASGPHEPWSFGPEVEEACRRSLNRRYRLLPYLYTLFARASRDGLPIARPMFMADPSDPKLRGIDDAFLLGRDLLVVADSTRRRFGEAPAGASHAGAPLRGWRRIDQYLDGMEAPSAEAGSLPAVYIRPGAIVPIGPLVQYSDEQPLEEVTALVAVDERGHAAGDLYEDDGESMSYMEGDYRRTFFVARPRPGRRGRHPDGVEFNAAVVDRRSAKAQAASPGGPRVVPRFVTDSAAKLAH